MQEHIILQHPREPHYVQIEIDVGLCRTAAPVGRVVLYGHTVVCKSITRSQLSKPRRKLRLGLTAPCFYLLRRCHRDILIFFTLTGHGIKNPPTTGLKKQPCSSIGNDIWHRNAHTFYRMDTYADTPAPETFPEQNLPYFGVNQDLSRGLCHRSNILFP